MICDRKKLHILISNDHWAFRLFHPTHSTAHASGTRYT